MGRLTTGPRILVNHAFATQRVTGQQRYAAEISARLLRSPDVQAIAPTGIWALSSILTWIWVQFVLPFAGRGSTLVSMTARAPIWRPRHVLVVHDLFVLTNPEWYSRLYVLTHAPLLRVQLRTAAAVVAISQPVADQVAQFRRGPVEIAPNAPSEVFSRDNGDEQPARLARLGIYPGQYFFAVGSKDPRKNLDRLAEAYGQLSPEERGKYPLVVAGGGNAIFRDQSVRWPAETIDVGYVEDDELRHLYRGAHSVVFISKAEGFGLPLVEAAAAGARSLLVSDIEVFRWICGDQVRYVDSLSVDAITDGLRAEIVAPTNKRPRLTGFDWDTSAGALRDVCDDIAGIPIANTPPRRSLVDDVAIVLASAGRPQLLAEALQTCAALEDVAYHGVVSVPDESSLPEDHSLLEGWTVLIGTRGAAAQRNAGMNALPRIDVVAFFDDDSVIRPDYLRRAVDFLDAHPQVVGLTGRVLLDGAVSGEISLERAEQALTHSLLEEPSGQWRRTRELYGCNLVVRTSGAPDCRFDDRLPLYSWLEDHDLARRLMHLGTLAKVDDCVIVHRAASSGGRQAHDRLGYSQVMNPIYLAHKGSFPLWLMAQQLFRPVAKNALFAVIGPQASWRRERLAGNWKAMRDALLGKITPEQILYM